MKKKFFILVTITAFVGIFGGVGVLWMTPKSFAPDNSSGDFCPKCKSKNVGKYFYGLPAPEDKMDSATIVAIKETRLIPGGCIVNERSPRYRCNECLYEWGSYLIDTN